MITRQHVLAIERKTGRNIPLRRRFNNQKLRGGGDNDPPDPTPTPDFNKYLNTLQSKVKIENVEFKDNDALVVVDMQRDFVPNSHDGNNPSTFGVAGGDTIVLEIAKLITRFLSKDRGYVIATRDYHPANHASFTKQKGPFPSHCVQGTTGAEIVPPIARALATSGLGNNKTTELHPRARITFKGFDPSIDSYGGAKYTVKNRGVCNNALFCTERSGSFNLPVSAHKVIDQSSEFPHLGIMPTTGNVNAPPDILFSRSAMNSQRLENLDIVKRRESTVFVVGLALDFCVVDTAINLAETGKNVYIIVDLCRPAFIPLPGKGYVTKAEDLAEKLSQSKVKLTLLNDITNLPSFNKKYYGFYKK